MYHTASDTLHWFAHAAQRLPDRVSYTYLKDHKTGVSIPLATLGRHPAGTPGVPRILLVFGEHAREVITSEIALYLGRLLADDKSHVQDWPELHDALGRAGEQPHGAGADGERAAWPPTLHTWASELLDKMTIQIVPIESLEARRRVEQGALCLRKTAATGVDLNRNWPFAWQPGEPGAEQYGGPSPLSEPQSRLLKGLIDSHPLAAYVNVHSGEWALYTPWDSKPAYGAGLPPDLPGLVGRLAEICDCMAGPAGAVSGYLAFGSSMDYSYVHAKVPYPLTVEVYGSNNQGKLQQGAKNKPFSTFPLVRIDGGGRGSGGSGGSSSGSNSSSSSSSSSSGDNSTSSGASESTTGNSGRPAESPAGSSPSTSGALTAAPGSPGSPAAASADGSKETSSQGPAAAEAGAGGGQSGGGGSSEGGDASGGGGGGKDGSGGGAGGLDAKRRLTSAAAGELGGLRPPVVFKAPVRGRQQQQQQKKKQQKPQQKRRQQQQQRGAKSGSLQRKLLLRVVPEKPDEIMAVYRSASEDDKHCFEIFNPMEEPAYREVVGDWLAAMVVTLRHVAAHLPQQGVDGAKADSSARWEDRGRLLAAERT